MPGVPERGELYDFSDRELGRIAGYETVFGAGNAVTGKGNIIASRKHSIQVATHLIEQFLGLGDGGHEGEEELLESVSTPAHDSAEKLADWLGARAASRPRADRSHPPPRARPPGGRRLHRFVSRLDQHARAGV